MPSATRLLRYFRRFVTGANARLASAREAQHRGDWATAEQRWRKVVKTDPFSTRGWIQLGNMLNELQRYEEAIASYAHAGNINPSLAQVPAGIAGVYERQSRWADAERYWLVALDLLERDVDSHKRISRELAHAYSQRAICARRAGAPGRAAATMRRAAAFSPQFRSDPANLPLRTLLVSPSDLQGTADLIDDIHALTCGHPIDPLAADTAERPVNLRRALIDLAPALPAVEMPPAVVALIGQVYAQANLQSQLQPMMERAHALYPAELVFLKNAFTAARRRRNVADVRRLARELVRTTNDFLPLHHLMQEYQHARQLRKARLLCLFLMRKWPHSRWHVANHILLSAETLGLDVADHLVRRELDAGRYDDDIRNAYSRAAYICGYFAEAAQRLEAIVAENGSDELHVLMGYALANAEGVEWGEEFFRRLAAQTAQARGAMIGLAHMYMRRRDFNAAVRQWRRILAVHNTDETAPVEIARSLYELRDQEGALRFCETAIAATPQDLGISEFHAWMLVAVGRYRAALFEINRIFEFSGPTWTLLDLAIQSAGQLGRLDMDWAMIASLVPETDGSEAASRLYHATRCLVSLERRDLIPLLIECSAVSPTWLGWAQPYNAIRPSGPQATVAAVWELSARAIEDGPARRLERMTDSDVGGVLNRPHRLQPTVHIVNKFEQPRGGSELHALDLAATISAYAPVQVWAPEAPHPAFTKDRSVSTIDSGQLAFPRNGVIVLVGVYFDIAWLRNSTPDRVIILYNTFEALDLHRRVRDVFKATGVRAELLFCSAMMEAECGFAGRFEPSPTDLVAFSPLPSPRQGAFALGRHSRDVFEKHHPHDWAVYSEVARLGGSSQVLGGSCMQKAFPPIEGMQLLAARNAGIADFLRGLDAYFYRTSTWIEPWGRVVIEAMACGLPVVAHVDGGYAQAIRHEVNGLLFETTEEAVRLVRRLVEEPLFRLQLGSEARTAVEALLSPQQINRLACFYLIQ